MINLKEFQDWAKEGRRSVQIEIDRGTTTVWVYDYDLMAGQLVGSFNEVNIEREVKERELAEFKKLSEKYGTE